MAITVTSLSHADLEDAITCLQRAFANDPYFQWVFPDQSAFSMPRNRASLRTRFSWGIKHAMFHVAKDTSSSDPNKVIAVACWLPPSLARPTLGAPNWTEYLWSWLSLEDWSSWASLQSSSWSLWLNQVVTLIQYGGRGGLSVKRYLIWKATQAQAQGELWTDPDGYYFCNIVAVLPEAQGKGVGKALMEEVLKTADAEGKKCYLESSRLEPNVKIYSKMGFELVRSIKCQETKDDEGITLYCMTRNPTGAINSKAALW